MAVRVSAAAIVAALSFLLTTAIAAGGAAATPVGLWQSVSDVDGKPSGYIRIREAGGEFLGVIERGVEGDDRAEVCDKCRGARHMQPLIGMTIISGVRRHGDAYDGGEILDPDTGSVYRVKLHPTDDGRRLEVRGYIGISLLGRTQTWLRVE